MKTLNLLILIVILFVALSSSAPSTTAQTDYETYFVIAFRQTDTYTGEFTISVLEGETQRMSVELFINKGSIGEYKIPALTAGKNHSIAFFQWHSPIVSYEVRYLAPPYQ